MWVCLNMLANNDQPLDEAICAHSILPWKLEEPPEKQTPNLGSAFIVSFSPVIAGYIPVAVFLVGKFSLFSGSLLRCP